MTSNLFWHIVIIITIVSTISATNLHSCLVEHGNNMRYLQSLECSKNFKIENYNLPKDINFEECEKSLFRIDQEIVDCFDKKKETTTTKVGQST